MGAEGGEGGHRVRDLDGGRARAGDHLGRGARRQHRPRPGGQRGAGEIVPVALGHHGHEQLAAPHEARVDRRSRHGDVGADEPSAGGGGHLAGAHLHGGRSFHLPAAVPARRTRPRAPGRHRPAGGCRPGTLARHGQLRSRPARGPVRRAVGRARGVVHQRRPRAGGQRPRPVRGRAGRHHARGLVGPGRRGPGGPGAGARAPCPTAWRRPAPPSSRCRPSPPRSTGCRSWSCPSSTALTARTAPCRACSSSRACRTSDPACWRPPWRWTRPRRRRSSPPTACRRSVTWCCATPRPRDARAAVDEAGLRYPVFVKPANLGSSVGVTKVRDEAALDAAVASAADYDEWIVIEQGVDGREIEVAVLGNREPRASVPGEIVSSHEFYDYEDKYVDGDVRAPRAGADRRGRHRRGPGPRLGGRSAPCGATAWPASTSSTTRAAGASSSTR